MTRVVFSRWWTLSSHTYCSSKACLKGLTAAFLVWDFLLWFCTAFLSVGEEKDFTMYPACCQSLVDVLAGDSFRAIEVFSEIRLNLSLIHGCLSDCHEGSKFIIQQK